MYLRHGGLLRLLRHSLLGHRRKLPEAGRAAEADVHRERRHAADAQHVEHHLADRGPDARLVLEKKFAACQQFNARNYSRQARYLLLVCSQPMLQWTCPQPSPLGSHNSLIPILPPINYFLILQTQIKFRTAGWN